METFGIFAILFTLVRVIKYTQEKYKYLKIVLKHSSTQSGPEVLTAALPLYSTTVNLKYGTCDRSSDFRGFA